MLQNARSPIGGPVIGIWAPSWWEKLRCASPMSLPRIDTLVSFRFLLSSLPSSHPTNINTSPLSFVIISPLLRLLLFKYSNKLVNVWSFHYPHRGLRNIVRAFSMIICGSQWRLYVGAGKAVGASHLSPITHVMHPKMTDSFDSNFFGVQRRSSFAK
jgi:hypothetical protein